jgi:hypothetical protein
MSKLSAANKDRASWADDGINAFVDTTGTDPEDAVSDLLCDIMHWCNMPDNESPGFEAELERAQGHYDSEIEEDDE